MKTPPSQPVSQLFFAAAVGAFLALTLLKFGNPVVLDYKLAAPGTFWEFLIWSWPVAWGYPLLAILGLWGVVLVLSHRSNDPAPVSSTGPNPQAKTAARDGQVTRRKSLDRTSRFRHMSAVIPWLPLAWFLWQCVSATQTVNGPLTQATLKHFAAVTACFYLGSMVLGRLPDTRVFWLFFLAGLFGVIAVGYDQHFGGLEATRQFIYSQPDWQRHSPEFLHKIASNRIYSTLFYPNTFAGVLLLVLPMGLALTLSLSMRTIYKYTMVVLLGFAGLTCLYWSGSKAGWLIALLMAVIAWLRFKPKRLLNYILVVGLLLIGLAGFFVKYAGYFEKGATSVGARLDYWKIAVKISASHPVLGSGPGTFMVLYRYLKPPEAEMARLVHNDYLEQACDSGLFGFVLYGLLMIGSLVLIYRRLNPRELLEFGVWLGIAALAGQSLVEFGLYVPALAWPSFLLLGWLWGKENSRFGMDKPVSTG
jgi:O-antigen ligase